MPMQQLASPTMKQRIHVEPNLFVVQVERGKEGRVLREVKKRIKRGGRKGLKKMKWDVVDHNAFDTAGYLAQLQQLYNNMHAYGSVNSPASNILINAGNQGTFTINANFIGTYVDPNYTFIDIIYVFVDNSSNQYNAQQETLSIQWGLTTLASSTGGGYTHLYWTNPVATATVAISKSSTSTLVFIWTLTYTLGPIQSPSGFVNWWIALHLVSGTGPPANAAIGLSFNPGAVINSQNTNPNGWSWYPYLVSGTPSLVFLANFFFNGTANIASVYLTLNGSNFIAPPPTTSATNVFSVTILWEFAGS